MKRWIAIILANMIALAIHAAEPTKDDAATERARNRAEEAEQIRTIIAAKDARIKEAETKRALEKKMSAAAIEATVRIIQIGKDGILARPVGDGRKGMSHDQALDDPREVAEVRTFIDARGKEQLLSIVDDPREPITLPEFIFINCSTKGLFDHGAIRLRLWPAGLHHYISIEKAERTVAKYSTSYLEEKK